MKFETQMDSDSGVSPVVGVILMVAITVILSAIIATFVLDLGGTVSQNPQAGVTFDQSASGQVDASGDGTANTDAYAVDIQIVSMENADALTADHNGANASVTTQFANNPSVGDTATVDGLIAGDKVTVTATLEGKQSVIQTYTVEG